MKGIRGATVALAIAVVSTGTGCTTRVKLAPTVLAPPSPITGGGSIAVAREAKGVPDTIGSETISVFAIPAASVRLAEANNAEQLMDSLRETLRAAGYQPVTAPERPTGPVLGCEIKEMHFKDYTWFMPMIHTWGTIRLGLSLADADGHVHWQKDYEGTYDGNGVAESFDKAVNVALGKILARAGEDFTTPEFHAACCSTDAP